MTTDNYSTPEADAEFAQWLQISTDPLEAFHKMETNGERMPALRALLKHVGQPTFAAYKNALRLEPALRDFEFNELITENAEEAFLLTLKTQRFDDALEAYLRTNGSPFSEERWVSITVWRFTEEWIEIGAQRDELHEAWRRVLEHYELDPIHEDALIKVIDALADNAVSVEMTGY